MLLATIPCCVDDNCNDEIKTEQTNNHSQDHTDADCDTCSPFFTCGTCLGFDFTNLEYISKVAVFTNDKFVTAYKSQFVSEFFAKIWQPPQMC